MDENLIEFIKYSIKNKSILKLKWILSVLALNQEATYEDEFIYINNKQFSYKKDEELILLTDKYTKPIFTVNDMLTVDNSFLPNITGTKETNIGILIMNFLITSYSLNNKVSYINKKFNMKTIEKDFIVKYLTNNEMSTTGISISEYHTYLDIVLYIDSFSKVLSVSASEKALIAPTGIKEFKIKLIKYYKDTYGEHVFDDPKIVAEYEDKLKDFDTAFTKGDVADGRVISGKVKNAARKRLYLSFGLGNRFSNDSKVLLRSLDEGMVKDPEILASMFNDSRAGSYGRGVETQYGGVTAKDSLRATSDTLVIDTDCGSTITIPRMITDVNKQVMIGRYFIEGGKLNKITNDNIEKYLNKTIQMRTGLACKTAPNFCTKCLGEGIKDYKNGISLLASGLGGSILSIALKKFHNSGLSLTTFKIEDVLG